MNQPVVASDTHHTHQRPISPNISLDRIVFFSEAQYLAEGKAGSLALANPDMQARHPC